MVGQLVVAIAVFLVIIFFLDRKARRYDKIKKIMKDTLAKEDKGLMPLPELAGDEALQLVSKIANVIRHGNPSGR